MTITITDILTFILDNLEWILPISGTVLWILITVVFKRARVRVSNFNLETSTNFDSFNKTKTLFITIDIETEIINNTDIDAYDIEIFYYLNENTEKKLKECFLDSEVKFFRLIEDKKYYSPLESHQNSRIDNTAEITMKINGELYSLDLEYMVKSYIRKNLNLIIKTKNKFRFKSYYSTTKIDYKSDPETEYLWFKPRSKFKKLSALIYEDKTVYSD